MEIYVDLRCLQDDNYARRGIGYHSSVLLGCRQDFLPSGSKLIGLIDSEMPPLATDLVSLVDETKTTFADAKLSEAAAFIELSPMTHDPNKAARLVGNPRVFSATIIYDFIPLDVPQRYLAHPPNAEKYATQLGWLPSYDHFFSISEYSARRLQEVFSIADSAIDVTGVALRPEFETAMQTRSVGIAKTGKQFPKKYVLCVAGGDKRKNVEVLLKAHAGLTQSASDLHLIIVGFYGQGQIREMVADYTSYGGKDSHLHIIHGIDDTVLSQLYHHAQVSACCSEIEGFSLPVIESIACGCPILVSDNAAHRELVHDDAAVFQPHDYVTLQKMLRNVLQGVTPRSALLEAQRTIPEQFSSAKVAERFWTPICRAIRQRNVRNRFSRASFFKPNRPRVAILSPFPPDASGVADYTRRTVQALGKMADVDVFTNATNPTPTAEVQNFFPISDLPYTSGFYDGVVAVVGNSHFHTEIIDLHNRFGGPCLIHDNRLAEFYNWIRGPEGFRELACKSLGRPISLEESQFWVHNPGSLPSPFFDELIPHAQPLIVHSRGIQDTVRSHYGIEAQYLPFCVYRDFPAATISKAKKHAARQRLGIAEDVLAMISLGIVSPTKGPRQCIEATSKARHSGLNAELYFVGSASGMENEIREWACEFGIEGKIHVCGDWVDSKKYTDFVIAADLAIQLRNHFFGGLSGAMLDCIASGLVTIANADLAEALESPASVLRISDSLVASEVAEQIIYAAQFLDLSDRLTADRESYLEAHSFEAYAVRFLNVLGLFDESNRDSEVRILA